MLAASFLGIEWDKLDLTHYLAFGGGAVALLAVLLYFLPVKQIKIPAAIVSTLCALVGGAALGMLAMAAFGYHWEHPWDALPVAGGGGPQMDVLQIVGGDPAAPPAPAGGGGGRGGGGPRMMNMGMGGGRGGGAAAGSKQLLVNLLTKIEQLTVKPPALAFNDEQKARLNEQLKGLLDVDELNEEDAKKRFDEVLKIVEGDRKTLEAAGYQWPGGGARGMGDPRREESPNPFKEAEAGERLKSLQEHLGRRKPI